MDDDDVWTRDSRVDERSCVNRISKSSMSTAERAHVGRALSRAIVYYSAHLEEVADPALERRDDATHALILESHTTHHWTVNICATSG
jgi:hypothetical protein